MTKALLRRIGTLETQCRGEDAQALRRIRIVLRAVDSRVGVGKATCHRSRSWSGGVFEVVGFYGCALGEAEPTGTRRHIRLGSRRSQSTVSSENSGDPVFPTPSALGQLNIQGRRREDIAAVQAP